MDLLDLLGPEHVVVPLRAPGLRAAVEQLVARLEESDAIADAPALHARIRDEPLRNATTLRGDAALVQFHSAAVPVLRLALGVAPDGVPVNEPELEGRPRLVALLLAPPEAAPFHLQTTATLARLLRQEGVVDRIVAQPDPAAVLALDELQGVRIQPSLTVRDVMSHRIHSVPPEASVRSTMDLMLRRRMEAVPVVGEKGEVLGIVTDSDLMRALLPQIPRAGTEPAEPTEPVVDRTVRDIMTRSVLCVSEDLGLNEVASMMINKDVEQVPVVHAGSITGMVSRGDIIRKLFGRA